MATTKQSKTLSPKYKPLFTAGLILIVIFGVCVGSHAIQAHKDVQTRKSAEEIGNAIDGYINTHKRAPATLSDAGVKNVPDTIYYKAIDDEHFRFCAVFKRANNPSPSRLNQFVNLLFIDKQPMLNEKLNDSAYYGVPSIDDFHLAGPDCYNIYYYTFWPKQQ